MPQLNVGQLTAVFPTLLEKVAYHGYHKSAFLKRIEQSQKMGYNNPQGLNTPWQVEHNATAFAIEPGGTILGGAGLEFTRTTMDFRRLAKSWEWDGDVERQIDNKMAEMEREKVDLRGKSLPYQAQNAVIGRLIANSMTLLAHTENYFALQGGDKSAIAVVTGITSTGANGVLQFSWNSTAQGNRMFWKNQQVHFYNGSAPTQRVAGYGAATASDLFSTVNDHVNKSAATNAATGLVRFDFVPTDIAIGDTVHFRKTYGRMPTGFVENVNDTGNYEGVARSTDYQQFASVVDRRTGSPQLTPLMFAENMSYLRGKTGMNQPMDLEAWMNNAQRFNFLAPLYSVTGTNLVRYIDQQKDGGAMKKYDPSVSTNEGVIGFDGCVFCLDAHVPPDSVFFINFASWAKYERTKLQAYMFDSGQYMKNKVNQYGEPLDTKFSTVYSEYNWKCSQPNTNGRITGLGFSVGHVGEP